MDNASYHSHIDKAVVIGIPMLGMLLFHVGSVYNLANAHCVQDSTTNSSTTAGAEPCVISGLGVQLYPYQWGERSQL